MLVPAKQRAPVLACSTSSLRDSCSRGCIGIIQGTSKFLRCEFARLCYSSGLRSLLWQCFPELLTCRRLRCFVNQKKGACPSFYPEFACSTCNEGVLFNPLEAVKVGNLHTISAVQSPANSSGMEKAVLPGFMFLGSK